MTLRLPPESALRRNVMKPLAIVLLLLGVAQLEAAEPHYLDRYDPVDGTVKTLKIDSKIDGKASSIAFPENAEVVLPKP